MSDKKRILFCGEASVLPTGFSTYYRELLPRLVKTGKYEIAELSRYIRQDHPEMQKFVDGRWKYYGILPMNEEEARIYGQPCHRPRTKGALTNQFGEYKFDSISADFKQDITVSISDWWMDEYIEVNPFRPWFKWCWMPTVDAGCCQHEEWIKTYESCDLIMTYADFGIHTLKQQSLKMRIFPQPMRPGVDLNIFKPMIKNEVREEFLLQKDFPIIGMIARNQSRKLYPDLIDAFALMKNKYKGEERIDKAVLLLHTCWPDNAYSYDYPRHIMRLQAYPWMPNYFKGIKDSVLQTLHCHNPKCGKISVCHAMLLYERPIKNGMILMPCMWCGEQSATCPTTAGGFTREQLAKVYNLLDLLVQCTICEGDGMVLQEAKSCKVPTLAVDYSAMREKGRFPNDYIHLKNKSEKDYTCHLGGDVIKVQRYYYEPETSCMRALPDIEDLATKMRDIITDDAKRKQMSEDARKCVELNYDWEKLAKQWEFVLDNIKIKDRSQTWDSPIIVRSTAPAPSINISLEGEAFIEWLYLNVLKYPNVDPDGAKMWLAHLQNGITREQLYQHFCQIATQSTDSENARQKVRAAVAAQKGEKVIIEGQSESENQWI